LCKPRETCSRPSTRSKNAVLIPGANGEVAHGLIDYATNFGDTEIVATDLSSLDQPLRQKCSLAIVDDILNVNILESLSTAHDFDTIFQLAALLSTRAERQPVLAHQVNVDGTLNLLEIAVTQSRVQGREINFMYQSSIAVYGLPGLTVEKVRESGWREPRTMYGINKLYCKLLGNYYSSFYRQLDADPSVGRLDFRCVRFPDLISPVTVPTGGTSDYASEMLHHVAEGKPYTCFVREDTQIPFMAMLDSVQALLRLEAAPRKSLSQLVYNVSAFNPSALEQSQLVHRAFPKSRVSFVPDLRREAILDSWPEDIDTRAAVRDWRWQPQYLLTRAFKEYLLPHVRHRHSSA